MAGEIGHVVVDESAALCRCGQRGCLEAVAAGPAIARAWPKGLEGTAATALFSAAAAGDPAAEQGGGSDRRVSDDGPDLAGGRI